MNASTSSQANPYAPPKAAVQDVTDPGEPLVPARRVRRLVAAIVDGCIFMLVFYAPLVIGVARSGKPLQQLDSLEGVGGAFAIALVGLAGWGFVTWRLVKANGQTIAKRLFGIKVVRGDGSPASVARIFWLRNVVNAIPAMIPYVGSFYFFVDSLFIFGERRQCLHDKIADTIVVEA